jgi:hypothetical protein
VRRIPLRRDHEQRRARAAAGLPPPLPPAQDGAADTFFPAGTNQAAVTLLAQNALADIEAELRRHLPAGEPDYDITGALTELLAADGLDFSINNRQMTIIDREDLWNAAVDGAVELVSFVPIGSNYESYDASLLTSLNLP